MITNSMIQEELNRCRKLRSTCKRRLQSAPFQSVFTKPQHGKPRLYTFAEEKEQYISCKNADVLLSILKNQVLQTAESDLADNIELLEKMKKNYKAIDTIFSLEHAAPVLRDMMQKISGTSQEAFWKANARNFLENELYPSLQQKPTDAQVRAWQDEPYKGNTSYPKQKIHRSPGGVWVRSKSELLIKSELEHYMIPHKYECPLQLEDEVVYPDFTVLRVSDWRVFYWEHLGKMDDPKYVSYNMNKLFRYFQAGYFPFEHLILTYDRNGTLDMQQVERIMKMLLM